MKTNPHYSRLLALISGALLFTSATAAEQPLEEIVVRGTPSQIELDGTAWRIDLKRHVSRIARSMRTTRGPTSEALVATARDSERG